MQFFVAIIIGILLKIGDAQERQNNLEFVHICGQFPNRYFSYEPCPEEQNIQDPTQQQQQQQQVCSRPGWRPIGIRCRNVNDCYQQRENVEMMCEQSECCAPPGTQTVAENADSYLSWQTCENGGYFTGQLCHTTADCHQGIGQSGQRLDPQLARYEQICLQGECCTTNKELDEENNNNNISPNPNPNPNSNPYPNNANTQQNANSCATFSGGRLLRNARCQRHGDCNRLVGKSREFPSVTDTQQLACVQQQCCLMSRQLPPGIIDWQQLCPLRQGTFAGMFCHQSDQDCIIGTTMNQPFVCELNRYCCTSSIDRRRRQNQGCDDGDLVTGSRCTNDQNCYRGEYCGDLKICCLPRGSGPQPDEPIIPSSRTPAFCYNGEQSYVRCEFQSNCLNTQSCVNGLCCVRSGNEWKSACGGAMAVSSCFHDYTCHDSLVCTSSDYCCECPYGQAAGKCTHGCPPNFACGNNGYCCPRCADGARPYGSCFNTQCAAGHICVAGNICCAHDNGTAPATRRS